MSAMLPEIKDNNKGLVIYKPSTGMNDTNGEIRIEDEFGIEANASSPKPRGWLNFLRQGRGRQLQSRSVATNALDSNGVADDDEDGFRTDPETDSGSDDSPSRKLPIDSEDGYAHLSNRDLLLELDGYARYFGFIDLSPQQPSVLSFPFDDRDEDIDETFVSPRDEVRLLSYFPSNKGGLTDMENKFTRRIENLMRRKKREDDEVALLSEQDDRDDDSYISFVVDSVDTSAISILEDLTVLELKRKALEGETECHAGQESAELLPLDEVLLSPAPYAPPTIYTSPVDDLLSEPEELQMWSEDLRKRLELQKVYQMRLSYGGRAPKPQLRENPHGELWTVREGTTDDEKSTGSDNTMEDC